MTYFDATVAARQGDAAALDRRAAPRYAAGG